MELTTELIIALMVVGNLILLGLGYVSWRLIFGTPRPAVPMQQQQASPGPVERDVWESSVPTEPVDQSELDPLAGLFRYDSWHAEEQSAGDPRFGDTGGVR